MAKKNLKSFSKFFGKITSKLSNVYLSTWYFTVIFFVVTLVVSLWVWWNTYYAPKVSLEVVSRIEAGKEDFEAMGNKTEKAIEILQTKQKNHFNPPDFSSQRELFMEKQEEETVAASSEPIQAPELADVEQKQISREITQ